MGKKILNTYLQLTTFGLFLFGQVSLDTLPDMANTGKCVSAKDDCILHFCFKSKLFLFQKGSLASRVRWEAVQDESEENGFRCNEIFKINLEDDKIQLLVAR